ncbi:MAG TPA: DUF3492 domain-containing protein [Symbiobacteriaceae bacterium]|jgi:glycosyltransferase involved in cell wall biosynthesis
MGQRNLDVLLTTEGTYPVEHGGVSTWCEQLLRRVSGVRFQVMTVMANPYLSPRRELPASVTDWIQVPLWGTLDPAENWRRGLAESARRIRLTTPAVVRDTFLPAFSRVVEACWSPEPVDGREFGARLLDLHRLFAAHDYQALMKNRAVWHWYREAVTERFGPRFGLEPNLDDVAQSLSWLYRFLVVVATPVPRTDITHASAAAFCAIPGVLARQMHGVPLLLTEHGVFLREQYAGIGRLALPPFQKRALLGLVQAVARAAYATADVVAPVAAFNTRWEREMGVDPARIRVIYNGIDPDEYRPRPRPQPASPHPPSPVVVSVARIDPAKDLSTLLQAAALVGRDRPDCRFVVYGSVSAPDHYEELLALRADLGLQERFVFAGHRDDAAAVYAEGDVVVLSSISEGFPYSVVEAMMCERPVVATDVGGVPEAVGSAGVLVRPRDPEAMAAAILRLIADPAGAQALGKQGRERAQSLFTAGKFAGQYEALYHELSVRTREGACGDGS